MVLVTQLRNSEIGHSLSVVILVVDGVTSRGCQRVQRVLNCFLESRYLRQLLGEEADAWFGRKLNSKEGTKVPGILGHPQQKRLRLQDTNSTFSFLGILFQFANVLLPRDGRHRKAILSAVPHRPAAAARPVLEPELCKHNWEILYQRASIESINIIYIYTYIYIYIHIYIYTGKIMELRGGFSSHV